MTSPALFLWGRDLATSLGLNLSMAKESSTVTTVAVLSAARPKSWQRTYVASAAPVPAPKYAETSPRGRTVDTTRATTNTSTHGVSLLSRIPPGAWDSHMHILDPETYPLAQGALYTPSTYNVHDAKAFESSVGLSNIVLVQPSIYGTDNSCMLDAMRHLGPSRCRGVVVFDPATTPMSTLREWHELGVRGVRVNLQSVGRTLTSEELERDLMGYADAIRSLPGWVIQVYVPMGLITALESVVPKLGVRLVIDHIGHPALPGPEKYRATRDPYAIEGFESLIRLLRGGQTFIKLSAPYRLSPKGNGFGNGSSFDDLAPVAREILKVAGKSRVVFATDWPHTRFEGLDIRPWMETVLSWCGRDAQLVERLFRGNAEDLWQVAPAGDRVE